MSTTEIIGKPLESLAWSPVLLFHPLQIQRMQSQCSGVYLIRYRDNPQQLSPSSMLYVGQAEQCLRFSLMHQYWGEGNVFLPDFVRANPLGIYFQYLCCRDCRSIKAYLLDMLNYPLCNSKC